MWNSKKYIALESMDLLNLYKIMTIQIPLVDSNCVVWKNNVMLDFVIYDEVSNI
jgi:hypothetical protein